MNRIIAAIVFFSSFPLLLLAGTNSGFTFAPKNGNIMIYFNQSDIKNIRDIRKIYQNLEDETCLELYKSSRTKYAFGFGLSMLGAVAMGLGIGDAMSSGAPLFGNSGDLILFISGDVTAIIRLSI
jgi:hypothetical protein